MIVDVTWAKAFGSANIVIAMDDIRNIAMAEVIVFFLNVSILYFLLYVLWLKGLFIEYIRFAKFSR